MWAVGADWCWVDLEVALNYGQATGAPQLLRFVTEHTEVSWLESLLWTWADGADYPQPPIRGLALLPQRW